MTPTPEQIKAFLEGDFTGPVCMVNLLKYKEKAVYEDGRETDLTGEQAYREYGKQMAPFVTSKGGKLLFSGSAKHMMIGSVEDEWDTVAIMEYPSREDFVKIVRAPEVAEFGVHRKAGLAGQLLIATSKRDF